MPPSTTQLITETLIFRVKEGINLEDAVSSAGEAFVQLINKLKAQEGGHQVEDRTIFLWNINWKSNGFHTAFINCEDYKSFNAGLGQVFDLEFAAPIKCISNLHPAITHADQKWLKFVPAVYTRFTSDTAAAFKSPVTEIAFLTLPNSAGEETRTTIGNALKPIGDAVETVGKSHGSSIGWVFEAIPRTIDAPDGESIALHGVFGYASIEDHMRWRETPEHAKAIEVMVAVSESEGLRDADIYGKAMFHVKFQATP